MRLEDDLTFTTLGWVKHELDETLDQAREALEAHVEEPGDGSQIRRCAACLHQVQGTLRMVELYGAALVAEEMEKLASTAAEGELKQEEEAYGALMRGIMQLPDYLERLLGGHRDIPIVLLPLLNDLRAVRGGELVAESSLFAPDLDVELPPPADGPPEPLGAAELKQRAGELRKDFQGALLKWFRDSDAGESLSAMKDELLKLVDICAAAEARKLWWSAAAVVDGLAADGIKTSPALKKLIGRVDREIKRLVADGEKAFSESPPDELTRSLLYYVAYSESETALIKQVRKTFRLQELMPKESELEHARGSMSGHNRELLNTVAGAIREDLLRVKDGLDLFLRTKSEDTSELKSLGETLRRVGDTLGMIGLDEPRRRVDEHRKTLESMGEGERQADENALMEVASSLLQVESSLDDHIERLGAVGDEAEGADESGISRAEMQRITATLLAEATQNLSKAKEYIVAFIEAPWDYASLGDVPGLLEEVAGAVRMLELREPADLLEGVVKYLKHHLIEAHSVPSADELDTMADALEAIEYYLGSLADRRPGGEQALALGRERVSSLGALATPAPREGEAEEPAAETEQELEPETSGLEVVDMRAETEERAFAGEAVKAGAGPSDDIDDEIREVFVEEVTEELENLGALYPKWKSDPEDHETLATIRRVFHTLKGSGRLVGALTLGEFSWKIENMLNRVLEGAREPTDAVFKLMDIVVEEAVPQLLADLKGEEAPTLDIEGLKATADRIAQGEEARFTPEEAPAGEAAEREEKTDTSEFVESARAEEETESPAGEEADSEAIDAEPEGAPAGGAGGEESEYETLIREMEAQLGTASADEDDIEAPAPEDEVEEKGEETVAISDEKDAGLDVELPAEEKDETDEAAAEAAMDSALYEIFSKEAGSHLVVVNAFLSHARPNPGKAPVSDDLVRSIHTLNGAASMAELEPVHRLTDPMEMYVKRLNAHGMALSRRGFEAIDEAVSMIEEIIDLAGSDSPEYPDTTELAATLRKLRDETPAAGEAHRARFAEKQDEHAAEEEATQATEEAEAPQEDQTQASGEESETAELEEGTKAAGAEELDPELVGLFLEEGTELLDHADGNMQRLRKKPDDVDVVNELQRDLHTLKGGARMAGLHGVGDLGHVLESFFEAIADQRARLDEDGLQLVESAFDRLHGDLEKAQRKEKPEYPREMIARIESALGKKPSAEPEAEEPESVSGFEGVEAPEPEEKPEPRVVQFPERDQEAEREQQKASALAGQQEIVRVRADLLDNLVNYAGEVSIYRARLEQEVGSFRFNLSELEQTVDRLRDQLRKLEIETEAQILSRLQREGAIDPGEEVRLEDFDPLELDRFSQLQQYSRALAESVADLVNIRETLYEITRESETLLLQQSRINSDLQEGLMRSRMVPFGSLVPRLRRLVRRTASELGRKARLEVTGAEGEMDRTVLDRMTAPLEHMLRNALAHGIELPEERKQAGKPEEGVIHIDLSREASEVVLRVSDDGRGIDLESVRRTAIKRGLLREDAELTDRDILGFILETGFSTAEEVSKLAGRGVGMDVVHAEIKQLSGSLDINSRTGEGTRFTVRLPFTLSVTQALMLRVGEDSYAVPLSGIEGVARVPTEEFMDLLKQGEGATYRYAGEDYEVQDLAVLLGREANHETEQPHVPVLIVRSGDQRAAVRVDELVGSREVVVKTVGRQLAAIPGIFGATILGDGSVVLILDLLPLVRRGAALQLQPEEMRAAREEVEEDLRPTIMVVDDSITMRKVTSRILERHDMQVMTAKDGVDAVSQLQERVPDLMLLDIEMPRMDGYELATHIRNDSRLKHMPIIMITSRTGAKHRERAKDIGVNTYLGKPYQEADLMEHINELLDQEQHAG